MYVLISNKPEYLQDSSVEFDGHNTSSLSSHPPFIRMLSILNSQETLGIDFDFGNSSSRILLKNFLIASFIVIHAG
ncbi:unnamed protein product [Trichobilharzia szidati]|nr:unnamed protein product [Trichobilharzia szidati]